MAPTDIYTFVQQEEANFESDEIQVGENWSWNLRKHVQLIFHLVNDRFFSGENNFLRAFKNIMEPLLNLAFWTEDLEVKDVVFTINSKKGRALSFLLKKYHEERYTREHDLDTLFDEITESDLTYGGVVVQRALKRPEVLPLNTLAFCDQTDMLGGPIAFKHHFSPSKLRKMQKQGWGSEKNGATISIPELITLATSEKDTAGMQSGKTNRVPGKTIEVYIVRGSMPEAYLSGSEDFDDYVDQVQIIAFYSDKKGKHGVTLYRKKESESNIKFFTSKKVPGRALGRGVGESLLHPQAWTNFLAIHKHQMLESAAKTPLYTDDPNYINRNQIQDMENLEITTVGEGKRILQVPTAAVANIQLYEKSINEWFEHSQLLGAAFDPILGKEAASGTTFRGQERTVAQGRGLHDRRRGQRAKFIETLYREWIIPDMISEILDGKKFIATLSPEELTYVSESMADTFIAKKQMDSLFKLEVPPDKNQLRELFMGSFSKGGNKQLMELLKDEFRGIEIEVGVNVAGKQKDLVNLTDKLLSVFQFIFANPQGFRQAMQIPALSKAFSDILEFSGLSEVDFASLMAPIPQTPMAPMEQPQGQPMQMNKQPIEV